MLGEQMSPFCSPKGASDGHGEQIDPFCSPRGFSDGRGEQIAPDCTPKGSSDGHGEQIDPFCSPKGSSDGHGEQNDPFCSPERVEDSYSEHKGPFRTSKGLHAFPYEWALPLLVSFCPAWDRKTFVIPLFLSPPEQKDFRNQLINNSLLNNLLALWSDADGEGTILERIGGKGTGWACAGSGGRRKGAREALPREPRPPEPRSRGSWARGSWARALTRP